MRRVDPEGRIATVAGTGADGFFGDGGPAADAALSLVEALAVAPDGTVYVADSFNARIRRIGSDGVITTVAGRGDEAREEIEPPSDGELWYPTGVAVDGAGRLFVADDDFFVPRRVRRQDSDGALSTLVPKRMNLTSPADVALGPDGTLYVADKGEERVLALDTDGKWRIVAGSGRTGFSGDRGPARQAKLDGPSGVAVSPDGSLFIADTFNDRVRRVDGEGRITTVAGTGEAGFLGDGGPATRAKLSWPSDVAVGVDGSLYLADRTNGRVRRVDPDGTITTAAGRGRRTGEHEGIDARKATFLVSDLALDSDGSIYVADAGESCLYRIGPRGTVRTIIGPETELDVEAIAVDHDDGSVYVVEDSSTVWRWTAEGVLELVAGTGEQGSGDGGPATEAELDLPRAIALGPGGRCYVADSQNYRVRCIGPDGVITTIAGNGEYGSSGDRGPATDAEFENPAAVVVGADGSVYVADSSADRIRRIDPHGVITTLAGTGEEGFAGDGGPAVEAMLSSPKCLALDPEGSLYVADEGNCRVRRIGGDGVITTTAGTGEEAFSGDGGPAVEARLKPTALAVGLDGSVYVGDSSRGVRRIEPLS